MKRTRLTPLTCCLLLCSCLYAQTDIPIGTWRTHLSYNNISSIATGSNKIYGAAESGVMVLDKTDNSLSSYNTLTGLSSTGISDIAFDAIRNQLLIGYTNGDLDIIRNNEVINFNRLKNFEGIAGSKTINDIAIRNNLAYIATDYGLVVFDLQRLELIETWRDLGTTGTTLKLYNSTFRNDSIFVATEKGVLTGNLNNNLLNFSNWKRFDTGDFNKAVRYLVVFNHTLFAAVSGAGLYYLQNGSTWVKAAYFGGSAFNALATTAQNLIVVADKKIWKWNAPQPPQQLEAQAITSPTTVVADEQGTLWAGDQQNGLISETGESYTSHIPNGPSVNTAFRLKYADKNIYAFADAYNTSGEPLGKTGALNTFSNGMWQTSSTATGDLTDIDFIAGQRYAASFGQGLEYTSVEGNTLIYDETNSTLRNTKAPLKSVYVTAATASGSDLWVTNYGAAQPLHRLQNGAWQSFTFNFAAARYPVTLAVDFGGNVWAPLDPAGGGGLLIFNKEENKTLYRTEIATNEPFANNAVRALAIDRDGFAWIGTDQGVAYFPAAGQNPVRPIFQNRFLLRDEKIKTIAVDGGNRKWIGSEGGAWLFDRTGENLIHHFTVENSPLPSNIVRSIAVDHERGEVFFSTDKGIVSYRAGATSSESEFARLRIFPNPVTGNFSGTVGISGLATDAVVKITDISGKLIWQTQADGGTATWNVRDYNGNRAATGIYLVFAATADGGESVVGKIAVVE